MTRELSCAEYNCVESPETEYRRRSPDAQAKAGAAINIVSTRGLKSRPTG
jgi:hypothetical protein